MVVDADDVVYFPNLERPARGQAGAAGPRPTAAEPPPEAEEEDDDDLATYALASEVSSVWGSA